MSQTQTLIEISVRQSYVRISVGESGYTWNWSSVTLERDGYVREGVYGKGIDILSPDSLGILSGILSEFSFPNQTYYDYRIREWMLSDSDSPLIQSLLILCDSIRESVTHPQIVDILDSIQTARLQSV